MIAFRTLLWSKIVLDRCSMIILFQNGINVWLLSFCCNPSIKSIKCELVFLFWRLINRPTSDCPPDPTLDRPCDCPPVCLSACAPGTRPTDLPFDQPTWFSARKEGEIQLNCFIHYTICNKYQISSAPFNLRDPGFVSLLRFPLHMSAKIEETTI